MKNKKVNTIKVSEQTKAGLLIIMISIVILSTMLIGYYIKFSGITNDVKNDLSSTGLNATINNTLPDDYDAEQLFANMYNSTLGVLTEGIAYGNTWLEICPNSQEDIDGTVYIKTCDERFNSIADLKNYVMKYITEDYADELIGDDYLDKDGSLWILPISTEKDPNYVGFESYSVKQTVGNKIIYLVKSKYKDINCTDNCEYTYNQHNFILAFENNEWKVSKMEIPY